MHVSVKCLYKYNILLDTICSDILPTAIKSDF